MLHFWTKITTLEVVNSIIKDSSAHQVKIKQEKIIDSLWRSGKSGRFNLFDKAENTFVSTLIHWFFIFIKNYD